MTTAMSTTITTTKRIGSRLLSPALLLVFAVAQPLYGMVFDPAPLPAAAANDNSPYAAGTRAMNEQRWQDAIRAFDKVIAAKEKRSDAALYWKAYSLNKLRRHSDAAAICNTLHAQYADSPWNKDCDVLSISNPDININLSDKITQSMNIHVNPDVHIDPIVIPNINVDINNNPDMKILALNSMLNQDPAKAIPILRGILNGNQSIGVKKHAIFVLAQSKSPEARAMLHDAVTGKMDLELQRQAITMMALFQGKRDDDTLAEVYRTTSDRQIKKSIISAFFLTQDAPHLVELARSEKDLQLKRTIVAQLSVMNDKVATDYMMELLK
ncbi:MULTISPECIES: HEAT repeat domain-containing protein [Acidobacteriaceae]|uniref:HEAT repeat domain-containing protein n=1 Tax=Acidobacteriaceae TaxID=204434 RepID=UPI0020B10B18|nr:MULTISPECIES: HEAT repeat domain-containing protein [Acidobacteriaceae]MDW5264849.1 HEAT repeat domain-containing protein [Edaphobacter sp.]